MDTIEILHIITDSTRFRLLQLLLEHHYCVKALAKKLGISESAVSQHMKILKKYQIVQGTKIGYQMHYQVDREKICVVLKDLLQQFSQYPMEIELSENWHCSCEFIAECMKRDSKILEQQGYGK